MNNDNNAFCPMPTPPKELAAALGWRSVPTADEVEEQASMDLFARTTAISNPWLARPGVGGVIEFGDDDVREAREYAAAIEPVAKLFQPKQPTATAPNLNLVPLSVEQDEDEKEYYAALAPIQKLFSGNAITTATSQPEASKQFTKRATVPAPEAPIEKSGTGLDTFSEELDADLQEALDAAIDFCLPSDASETTADFFSRVDRRLEALGHRPILSVPTWMAY